MIRRAIGPVRALVNGVLCLVILGLGGYGMYLVAERHWLVRETFRARTSFQAVSGLEPGGQVRVQGVEAGVIERIEPPRRPGDPVELVMRLDARLRGLVRSDAIARISVQGVVGAKVVEISPGKPDAPPLGASGTIGSEEPVELADLPRVARRSLDRVDMVARAAEEGLGELNAITGGIGRGEGTLGRLVKDDEAYERITRLASRGEETLGDLNENLDALKHTWPISRYFNNRAYFDKDRALYKPGSARESRTMAAGDLFEPNRAILTARGREVLDEVARWCEARMTKESEVVIAAFSDEPEDAELAHVLTQEQADAVRRYLVDRHELDSVNWFKSRKVAAIGFGTEAPRTPGRGGAPATSPARRVELILFTPQA